MSQIYYTEDHEWILVEGDIGICGISEFAQEQLGDIVYVELPEPGTTVAQNDELAVVESVKAASEIYAPVSGEIIESNEDLAEDPAKVNADAMGGGWFFKIRISNAKELEDLLDKAAYDALTAGQT
jgi:glycine cleavage system H protein